MLDTNQILSNFYNTVYATVEKVYTHTEFKEHLTAMVIETPTLMSQVQVIGNKYDQIITDVDNISAADIDKYIILHKWIEEAKSLLILWRDTLLEEIIAYHYHKDGKTNSIAIKKIQSQSKEMLLSCLDALKDVYPSHISALDTDEKEINSTVFYWAKQLNPWPVYLEQIKELSNQTRKIDNLSNQISRTNTYYNTIRRILNNYMDKRKSNLQAIAECAEQVEDNIVGINQESEELIFTEKIHRIDQIHQQLNQLFVDNHHLEQIERIIHEMPDEVSVPVSQNNGMLKIKEINFQKETQQWLDSEIYLSLYEVEEIEDRLKNTLKMALVNMKNSLTLIKSENAENNNIHLNQSVTKFVQEYNKAANKHKMMLRNSANRLQNRFNISDVFSNERFYLPGIEHSTLGNIDLNNHKWRHKVLGWVKNTFSIYDSFRQKVINENRLSLPEKLVRYVDSRKLSENTSQYTNIFLVKGYIGESFVIGRKDELKHLQNIYNQWNEGYRGSVLLTGQRFSGKSLFAEYVNIKILEGKAILLKPRNEYEVNGKTHTATNDIDSTLSNITRQTQQGKHIVIIDDIEQWYDDNISLATNVRNLCRIIDRHSSRVFFIVTMSNWLKYKMEKVYHLDKVFQADINLDRMSLREIQEVIRIRQGATHKNLVNTEGIKVTAIEFGKITKSIHNTVQGNVGDALYRWASSTEYHHKNAVQYNEKQIFNIPDIVDNDTLLLLETIMMARRTKEYYLNKIFGDAFRHTYSSILQRLISVGLVTRNLDNMIEINPYVVNDIGRILERKHYLNFNHR